MSRGFLSRKPAGRAEVSKGGVGGWLRGGQFRRGEPGAWWGRGVVVPVM